MKRGVAGTLRRLAAAFADWLGLELEIWSFFLFGWFRRPRVPRRATAFTHHQDAGWSAIAAVLGMLLLVEGAVVHLWLADAGHSAALWIALALHVYGFVWITGDALALRVNRTCLLPGADGTGAVLELRVGVRARGRFPASSITQVRTGAWDNAGPEARKVGVSGPANVEITFARAMEFKPRLGAPVHIRTLLLQVDDPERFERALGDAAREAAAELHIDVTG